MAREQRQLQDNFEDYAVSSNLDGQGGHDVTITDSATATVVSRGGSNVGKFFDPDATSKVSDILTLPFPPKSLLSTPRIGTKVEIDVENITGSHCFFGIADDDASTGAPATFEVAIYLEPTTNKVQYFTGSVWTDTGFTWVTAIKTKYTIEVASTSTFYIWQGNVRKGPFNNQVNWTDLLQTVQITTGLGTTSEFYIDNIFTVNPHSGFQYKAFEARGTQSTAILNANYPPAYTGGTGGERNILVPTSGGAVRRAQLTNDWVSWSSAIANAQVILVADFAGLVYSSGSVTGSLHAFSKSTDYGVTFTSKAGTGINDGKCHGMFVNPAGGSNPLYLVSRRNANNNIDLWRYNDSLNNWSVIATQAITAGSSHNNQCWGFTLPTGNDYYFLADDNDIAQLIEFDYGTGTISKQGNPITISGTSYHCAGDSYPIFYSTPNIDGGDIYATVINNSTSAYTLVKTSDSGTTWTVVATGVQYRFIYPQNIDRNQTDVIDWTMDVATGDVGEFDTNLDHFIQRKSVGSGTAYFAEVNATEKNHVLFDQDDSEVDVYTWELLDGGSIFKETEMIQSGNQEKYTFKGGVSPSDVSSFTIGDIVDFFDGFGTLALRAKHVENKNPTSRSKFKLHFDGLNAEFREKHRELFSSKTTKQIMQDIIDDRQFVYHDDSIDYNSDFTTTYTRLVQDLVANVGKFGREMENALFYTEPDGKVRMHAKSRAISTGLRWSEQSFGLRLKSHVIDNLIRTRSEVTGAWNRGTSDTQQIRRVYIGDAGAERNGIVAIEKNDNQIRNDTECLQIATNRYTMYGNQIQVVKLQADNFGFIQPGETIEFSWSDTRTTIPLTTFYVMRWEWDIRIDRNIIWLVDNIITEEEFFAVQTTIKEDDDLKSTYSDETVESTADGTVITLNPVGKLQAGTWIWRIPEPSVVDFDLTNPVDFPNNTSWNDLDLSSIIPAGVARGVRLEIEYQTPFVGDNLFGRQKGQANAIQKDGFFSQIANKPDLRSIDLGVNESGVCELKVDRSPSNWSTIDVTVLAWIL